MRLFIRAVNRPSTNIFSTLANLATRDPQGFASLTHVHIVSGDGDKNFLSPFERTNSVTVHFCDDAVYEKIGKWQIQRKGAWSYLYFLQLARQYREDAIVMEDDVQVANGWVKRIRTAMAAACVMDPDRRWALSAYYGFPQCPFAGSKNVVETAGSLPFWGNLMTVWPNEMLAGAHECFKTSVLGVEGEVHADLVVQHFLQGHGAKLFFVNPGIVEHLGDKTTMRDDGVRRASSYEDYYTGGR